MARIIIWIILYVLLTNLLVCAWIKFDARRLMINHIRWYKFCLFVPIIGAVVYAATKQSNKAWTLITTFWLFVPGTFLVVYYLVKFIRMKTAG